MTVDTRYLSEILAIWLWHDIAASLKEVKTTADQLQTWIIQLGGEVVPP